MTLATFQVKVKRCTQDHRTSKGMAQAGIVPGSASSVVMRSSRPEASPGQGSAVVSGASSDRDLGE